MYVLQKTTQMSKVRRQTKLKKSAILYILTVLLILGLNIAAWNSTAFCDAYIAHVFPVWVNLYGRLTGLFPFSVGEWMIVAGVVLLIAAVVLFPAWIVCRLRKKQQFLKKIRKFYRFFAWVLLAVCLIMTLNCFILYHASTFSETYFGEDDGDYTIEELMELRNMVVEQCNRFSGEVKRSDDGSVIFENNMKTEARTAMKELGKTYAQLDGWYPKPKALLSSDFMCQQYMQGYYFPFSMEANYNDVMNDLRKPATMCHELAHLRGYIFEDEANFIAYLACIRSDNTLFQYSGYLSVLNYLDNDLYRASKSDSDGYKAAVKKVKPLIVYQTVRDDNFFVSEEEWDRINGKAWLDTKTVDEVTDTLVDTSLKANGVSDGMVSYSRVVRLLLQYYRQG